MAVPGENPEKRSCFDAVMARISSAHAPREQPRPTYWRRRSLCLACVRSVLLKHTPFALGLAAWSFWKLPPTTCRTPPQFNAITCRLYLWRFSILYETKSGYESAKYTNSLSKATQDGVLIISLSLVCHHTIYTLRMQSSRLSIAFSRPLSA